MIKKILFYLFCLSFSIVFCANAVFATDTRLTFEVTSNGDIEFYCDRLGGGSEDPCVASFETVQNSNKMHIEFLISDEQQGQLNFAPIQLFNVLYHPGNVNNITAIFEVNVPVENLNTLECPVANMVGCFGTLVKIDLTLGNFLPFPSFVTKSFERLNVVELSSGLDSQVNFRLITIPEPPVLLLYISGLIALLLFQLCRIPRHCNG